MNDGSDSYIPQKTGGQGGKLSFSKDGSYSDSFVRSETQPLAPSKRRMTRPLSFTPEALQREIDQGLEQLRTCQIIIDKFAQRIRILQWAVEHATRKASAITITGKEKQIGDAVLRSLNANPDTRKRVQIAVFQYNEAAMVIKQGHRLLSELSADPDYETSGIRMNEFDIAKIQGKIYPICNFHEVFKKDVEISLLFPPPANASEPEMKMATMVSNPPPDPRTAPPLRGAPPKTNPLMEKLSHNPLMDKLKENPLVEKIGTNPLMEKLGNSALETLNNPLLEKLSNPKEALEKLNPMEKLGGGMEKLKGLKGMLGKKKDG